MAWEKLRRLLIPLAAASVALWIAICFAYPLTDTDIWWHLAAAKMMISGGGFLYEDPFCLVSLGAPWIDLHWGFQILAHALWSLGGAPALVAFKVAAVLFAFTCVIAVNGGRSFPPVLLPLLAFGCYQIRFWVDMRPLVVTLAGLSIQYAIVILALRGRWKRPWLALSLVQILLVNTQGLHPLGPILVSCFAWEEWLRARKLPKSNRKLLLPVSVLVMWVMGFLNPYGWRGFFLPLSLFARITPGPGNVFSSEIAENQPLFSLIHHNPWALAPHLVFLLAVLWTFDLARKKISVGHVLVFAGFALLGFMAQRNLPLTYLAGVMAASFNLNISEFSGANPIKAFLSGRLVRLGSCLALAGIYSLYALPIRESWRYELPGTWVTPFRLPTGAVEYMRKHPLPGNIFNEIRYGGYLAYGLYPEKLAFVDGRMIIRDAEFYREFLKVVDKPEHFPAYREKYGLTHVLLPIAEDNRFIPLLASLAMQEDWSLLFCDGASVLLALNSISPGFGLDMDSLPPGHPVHEAIARRFSANPLLQDIAKLNFAEFLVQAGRGRAIAPLVQGQSNSRAAKLRSLRAFPGSR